jgi:hypothetical protein
MSNVNTSEETYKSGSDTKTDVNQPEKESSKQKDDKTKEGSEKGSSCGC